MKRYNNLYNKITFNDFLDVYKEVRSNTKNKKKTKKFEDFYSVNIVKAYNSFKDKNYKVGKYNIFLIREPKYRIIMSQNITDKLINHIISRKILLPILDKSLIDTNIATRIGKGTHYGIKKLKSYLNELKVEKIYALKFDISKYFYNIDHEILINLIKNKIKDKGVIDLIINIINSTDEEYVNKNIKEIKEKEINKLSNKKQREEVERIPLYIKGKGLPIGNMSSQILAIYYLNELDHFIKENFKCKYYIRYMDDGLLLSNNKEYLRYCLKEIIKVLDKYKLKTNNKTKIIDVSNEGIDFLGFRFYIKNKVIMKVRNKTKLRFIKSVKLYRNDLIGYNVINSYISHLKWGNCYFLAKIETSKGNRYG